MRGLIMIDEDVDFDLSSCFLENLPKEQELIRNVDENFNEFEI